MAETRGWNPYLYCPSSGGRGEAIQQMRKRLYVYVCSVVYIVSVIIGPHYIGTDQSLEEIAQQQQQFGTYICIHVYNIRVC